MDNIISNPLYYIEGHHEHHKKGGGSPDTSGLEKATAQATALQRDMYEQTREDTRPWYDVGRSGMGKLADLMGISGGSVMDRQGIYDELTPQYQTTTEAQNTGMYLSPTGLTLDLSDPTQSGRFSGETDNAQELRTRAISMYDLGRFDKLEELGFKPFGAQESTTSTDYEALNAAVEERLTSQNETPEGFGSLMERFGLDNFEEDPGYQYRQQQGNQALERAMAAQGVTLGGGGMGEINPQVARALQEQNQNLASQEWGNAYNRYNADQQNDFNRLMGISGMGQNTTGQLQQAGQSYATNAGNLQTGLASAQLNAAQAAAAQPSMFDQLLQTGTALGSAAIMASDERLKENIKEVGFENGHKIYEFDYRDGSGRHRGVMAQDVIKKDPDAVKTMSNGFYAVDYGKIGLKMERV